MTPAEPAALAHIERTLADAYQREIDREENIWRSLPFFAATLALQLAALFQVIEHLPYARLWPSLLSYGLLVLAVGCSLGGLVFLAWSVFPATFLYIARDTDLLDYAVGLMEDEDPDDPDAETALHTLKLSLARQYCTAADNNRRINKARERRRSVAGLLTILSVISTLVLVAATFATYVPRPGNSGAASVLSSVGRPGIPDPPPAPRATGPTDAGGH